jgi:hypothetical protein
VTFLVQREKKAAAVVLVVIVVVVPLDNDISNKAFYSKLHKKKKKILTENEKYATQNKCNCDQNPPYNLRSAFIYASNQQTKESHIFATAKN